MKCNAMVLYKDARKKGSGEPYKKAAKIYSWWALHQLSDYIKAEPEMIECDGELEVELKVEVLPDWGGTYSELQVVTKCKKCGNTNFGELTQYNVSKVLTGLINRVSREELLEIIGEEKK